MPVQVGLQITCGLDMARWRGDDDDGDGSDSELTHWGERSNGLSWVGNVGLLEVMRGEIEGGMVRDDGA